jgi:hypothetical protein
MTINVGTPVIVPVNFDDDGPDHAFGIVTRIWFEGDTDNKPMVNVFVFTDYGPEKRTVRMWDAEPAGDERNANAAWYANSADAPSAAPVDSAAAPSDGSSADAAATATADPGTTADASSGTDATATKAGK